MKTMTNRPPQTTHAVSDAFIASLVADLKPTPPLTQSGGMARAGLAALAAIAIAIFGIGIRRDLAAGQLDPVFLLSSGLFLLLACASAWSVIQMSRPHVGNHQSGWIWAIAMAALLPVSALLTWFVSLARGGTLTVDGEGWQCLVMGTVLGALMPVLLTLWLRRGAPTSPERAGLLTGIAAGSSGIFAFALHCPHNDIAHIGLWHGLAVVVSAVLGRLIVPSAIRW